MNKNIYKLSVLAAIVGVLASCEIHFGPISASNDYSISRNSVSKSEGEGNILCAKIPKIKDGIL